MLSKSKPKETVSLFRGAVSNEIASIKHGIDALGTRVADVARTANKSVHANPYPYVLGSLGVGFIVSKILKSRSSRED